MNHPSGGSRPANDWRAPLLEEIARTEREALAEVEALVQEEAAQVRLRVDAERHRLRQALVERARRVSEAGLVAAARALEIGGAVATRALHEGDPDRAMAAHAAAERAHDRLREAADALADDVRAAEGELSGPVVRASRSALSEGLPGVRRVVAEAAQRTADDLRGELEVRADFPRDGLTPWRRAIADTLLQARETVAEQAAAAIRTVTHEVDRAVEAASRATDPLPATLLAATEAGLAGALDAAVARAVPPARPGAVRRVAQVVGASMAIGVVVGLGVIAMTIGSGVAIAAFGAMALWGSFAPPVTGGLLAGFVAVLLGALATDLLFGALGSWREDLEDGLLGVVGPAPRPLDGPSVDLGDVLRHLRLPELVLLPAHPDPGGVTDPGRFVGGLYTSTLLREESEDVSEG